MAEQPTNDPSGPPSGSRSPISRSLFWIPLLAIVGWLVWSSFRPQGDLALKKGASADYTWKLVDLEGKSLTLEAFKGKPVFLNIWATWCPPCVAELPSIESLAANQTLRSQGIEVVAVSVDGDPAIARDFVAERGYKAIRFLAPAEDIPEVFQTRGIPATFIIAPDGRIVTSELGGRDWNTPETVQALTSLVSGKPQVR